MKCVRCVCALCVYVYLNPDVFVCGSVKPVRLSTYMQMRISHRNNIWGFELLSNKIGLALIFQSQFFRMTLIQTKAHQSSRSLLILFN